MKASPKAGGENRASDLSVGCGGQGCLQYQRSQAAAVQNPAAVSTETWMLQEGGKHPGGRGATLVLMGRQPEEMAEKYGFTLSIFCPTRSGQRLTV